MKPEQEERKNFKRNVKKDSNNVKRHINNSAKGQMSL
jgi:hypothetical protein